MNDIKLQKLLAKQERKFAKQQYKQDTKLAKQELKKIKAGRINAGSVNRLLGALRVAVPFLLPLVYRAITQVQKKNS
ncbi:MAG: DUF6474 family protein [Corynebacterium sp.]|nr:DUF6474 family protein [Corynebacterium sp.]